MPGRPNKDYFINVWNNCGKAGILKPIAPSWMGLVSKD
jgi:hypothetical protein